MSSFFMVSSTTLRSSAVVLHFAWGFLPIRTASITFIGNVPDDLYGTYPMILERSLRVYSDTFFPLTRTSPTVGVRILFMQWINVDFPTPFGPIMDTNCGPFR